jgi:hypothetical protein
MAACALALGAPGVAHAQGAPPSDASLVAGPLADGTTLVAFDRGDRLCVALRGRSGSSCAPPPESALHPVVESEATGTRGSVYGTVPADVATVEVLAPGETVTATAGAGAYAGRFVGRVKFFLAPIAGRPYRVRLLDAQGRVLGAADIAPAPSAGRPVAIARGRVGGKSWRVVATQRSVVAPTPLDLARTEPLTCLDVRLGRPLEAGGGCAGRSAALAHFVTPHCRPDALAITGVAGPAVARIEAVLGDGSRRRVALVPLPARFGGPRSAFALVLGKGIAVRSLLVRSAGRTQTVPVRSAPGGAACATNGAFGSFAFGVGRGSHPSGSGPVVARDEGDDLCVGLGTIVPADCSLPPVEPLFSRVERRPASGATSVLAVTPSTVAALRLRFDRGPMLTVSTADVPGYAGRYLGLVRVASITVAGDRRLYSAQLLAADGRVLGTRPGPDLPPLPHTPTVIAQLPGGVAVAATSGCIQIGTGMPTRDRGDCVLTPTPGVVAVPCAAQRTVVVARARRRLTVTTDHGTVHGRRSGGYVAAVVPARSSVRAIRLAGARPVLLRLPPASRQCGYTMPLATFPGR